MPTWGVKLTLWLMKQLSRVPAARFGKQLKDPDNTQQQVFRKIIKNLANSQYGQSLKIPVNCTYAAFRQLVPIVNYDDLTPWIEKAKQGAKNILSPEPIIYFEKTSGSHGAAKYIPYSNSLLRSFNRMFVLWMHDILWKGPRFNSGRLFMSISPPSREEKLTAGGIPIGLQDDSHYLQIIYRWLVKPFVVHPPRLADIENVEEFRYVLAAIFLAEPNLEVISIWNPTYFLILLETIMTHRYALIQDLSKGFIHQHGYHFVFPALSAARIDLLNNSTINWQKLWPNLKFISCWSSATAFPSAEKLKALFPRVFFQGKGLLTTEAPITIPYLNNIGGVPLIGDIFLEFRDEAKNIYLIHQLCMGASYEIIISQKSGLYRYCLGDRVKVISMQHNTPCLEFIGSENAVCDLVGEKLTADFVYQTLLKILPTTLFSILVPYVEENGIGHYILLAEPHILLNPDKLDEALSENYHFQQARILGQLKKTSIMTAANMNQLIKDFMIINGMRWGNIKEKVLLTSVSIAQTLIEYITKRIEQQHTAQTFF